MQKLESSSQTFGPVTILEKNILYSGLSAEVKGDPAFPHTLQRLLSCGPPQGPHLFGPG